MKKLILATLMAAPFMANAVTDIQMKPIEARSLSHAQNVQSGPYDLPIITWGGDIATILGNGTSTTTKSGSEFKNNGLGFKLKREDVFQQQLNNYISGKTPYLRGTMSMINMAAAAVKDNPNLAPVVFYQLTWSAGGDALVVKSNIRRASDLCGKTIALNYDGPHLNYANRILTDAGCDVSKNKIVWTKDLTGTDESPMEALRMSNVAAAFVIIPDAFALTSGGNVGDGSEDSVNGAHILLSTKTANRVIADVYAVRKDYYERNKGEVESLAGALFKSQENLQKLASTKGAKYDKLMAASAGILLDAPEAIADTEGLLLDAEIAAFNQNVEFFQNESNFRNFEQIVSESAKGIQALGVINAPGQVHKAELNYGLLANGLSNSKQVTKSKFDSNEVSKIVERKQKQNSLDDSTVFEFEVYFKPNQKVFNESLYEAQFKKVLEMSSTYGGAVIIVEGHSDPMGYLRKKKSTPNAYLLSQVKQSAKNLSMTRAQQVRQAVVNYSSAKNLNLDTSQLSVIGHGITNPKTGICGIDPCAPKTEQQWLSNMRVVFRILQIEAEETAFSPL
ncbi:nitrate ABC transporter substrate-binding protein [Vibrio pomeroyi]|uniref:Nitrate ABC transporter substrate-binding protein n=1 Tax=Vibrio pomeroyi TaxID=198832 RepID=A0ABV4MR10_9VIBR|nr:nitrate ABC transporter substrate-binding protein [Vibrio atlanticus]MCZ4311405.1 nitrate ABC transporter substrate-binding protein [Vibrio atlanticus]